MGKLWLGGAEGLIAQNFTQITGADTGFPEGGDFTSTPRLGIVCVTSFALRKIEKHPPSWTFTSTPPLDIVRVTSSALQKIEKHPPPTIAAAQKKDRRCPKNWVAQKLGGAAAPPAPPPHTPMAPVASTVIGLTITTTQVPFVVSLVGAVGISGQLLTTKQDSCPK